MAINKKLQIIAEIKKQLNELDERINKETLVSKKVELMAQKRNLQQLLKSENNG